MNDNKGDGDGDSIESKTPAVEGWQSGVPLGELLNGEVPRWTSGVCIIEARRNGEPIDGGLRGAPPKALVVKGEGGHRLIRVPLTGDVDPQDVDRKVAQAVETEHARL